MDALDPAYINDKRQQKEFKSKTFSGYKKTAVYNELIKSINDNKIESALHWTAELLCAGYIKELWEALLLIMGKHIHIANPKIIIYIHSKYNDFREIVNNAEIINSELELRNNSEFRKLFTEIVAIFCLSEKRPTLQKINIKKEDFILTSISDKFIAPSIEYVERVFKKADPKEIFVPLNEFAYNLSSKNMMRCIYWMEWMFAFDQERRKQKNPVKCVNRTFMNVQDQFETDLVWILWECILEASKNNRFVEKSLNSLLDLFCIRYSFAVKSKRRYLLYFAIELIVDNINTRIPIVEDKKKQIVERIIEKTNVMYKFVKKNEVQPQSSYLLNSVAGLKSEKEKSVNKFDKIFEIGGFG